MRLPPFLCYSRVVADVQIAPATAGDVDAIKTLLVTNNLPTSGVDEHWKTFVVARDGNAIVGCGGSETYPVAALIRSIAVDRAYRSQGVGRSIVRQLLDRLSARGIREFYLLTTDADAYFVKRGFKAIDRDEVHPQVLASTQFTEHCCSSAKCMRLVMLA